MFIEHIGELYDIRTLGLYLKCDERTNGNSALNTNLFGNYIWLTHASAPTHFRDIFLAISFFQVRSFTFLNKICIIYAKNTHNSHQQPFTPGSFHSSTFLIAIELIQCCSERSRARPCHISNMQLLISTLCSIKHSFRNCGCFFVSFVQQI